MFQMEGQVSQSDDLDGRMFADEVNSIFGGDVQWVFFGSEGEGCPDPQHQLPGYFWDNDNISEVYDGNEDMCGQTFQQEPAIPPILYHNSGQITQNIFVEQMNHCSYQQPSQSVFCDQVLYQQRVHHCVSQNPVSDVCNMGHTVRESNWYLGSNPSMMGHQFLPHPSQYPQYQVPQHFHQSEWNTRSEQPINLFQHDLIVDEKKKETKPLEQVSQDLWEQQLEVIQGLLEVEGEKNIDKASSSIDVSKVNNNEASRTKGRPKRSHNIMVDQHSSSIDPQELVVNKSRKGGPGRPRNIFEPNHLSKIEKKCPHCNSVDTRFQYFNNLKSAGQTQPRYKCLGCTKTFTYYPC
jgi:hypothetical protein